MLYHLAANPHFISPLREEIEAIIAVDGRSKAALNKMRKIDSFIKETLRVDTPGICTFTFYNTSCFNDSELTTMQRTPYLHHLLDHAKRYADMTFLKYRGNAALRPQTLQVLQRSNHSRRDSCVLSIGLHASRRLVLLKCKQIWSVEILLHARWGRWRLQAPTCFHQCRVFGLRARQTCLVRFNTKWLP